MYRPLGMLVAFALSMGMGHPYRLYGPQQTASSQPGMAYNSMMGGPYDSNLSPIGMKSAERRAQEYLASLNNPDLEIDELKEHSNNCYVSFKEHSIAIP